MKVLVLTAYSYEPILRQTVGRLGVMDGCTFVINQPDYDYDAVVIWDEIAEAVRVKCADGRLIFASAEPPDYRTYRTTFLNQFDAIISPHAEHKNAKIFREQLPLNWWAGIRVEGTPGNWKKEVSKDYDALLSIKAPPKNKLISVIASNKEMLAGHRQRLQLIKIMKDKYGSDLDIYGFGFDNITDKLDCILPYKYHLTLENSRINYYWSEKLSDAFLGWSLPIYSGCTNIEDYFPQDSLVQIDPDKPDQAIAILDQMIREDAYTQRLKAIEEARRRVLNELNMFSVLARICKQLKGGPLRTTKLLPQSKFRDPLPVRIIRFVKNYYK